MTRDLYGEARALGADLADIGHSEWHRRIDDAIDAGATGSEILMALNWILGRLVNTEQGLPEPLLVRVGSLRSEIARALG